MWASSGQIGNATSLPTRAQGSRLGTNAEVRDLFAKCCCQIDLMVLLLHQDLSNLFAMAYSPSASHCGMRSR